VELLLLSFEIYLNQRPVLRSFYYFEGKQFHVLLELGVIILPANHPLCLKDCIRGILRSLVVSTMPNEPFILAETDHGWNSGGANLIISNNFNFAITPHSNAREGSTQINTYSNIANFLHFGYF